LTIFRCLFGEKIKNKDSMVSLASLTILPVFLFRKLVQLSDRRLEMLKVVSKAACDPKNFFRRGL
jgi:hypothetical protein